MLQNFQISFVCQDCQGAKRRLCVLFVFITALHVMQRLYSDKNSVRLYVCLSVTRVRCDKTEERSVQIFIPYET